MLSPPVELSGVSVAIAGRPILRGIDLTVTAGSRLAVMGANGSGKSTMIRAITGLIPIATGTARLFGTPLDQFRDWSRIGFVPQRGGASSGVPASVWEVVTAGRLAGTRPWKRIGRADRAAVGAAIEAVGLGGLARQGIATLSGGQQQRALIARALAGEPDLIIFDEPTAGVDLPNQQALTRILTDLADRGATLVVVAHELGTMTELIDRVVVMRDGRIAYDGPPLSDEQVHHPEFGEHPAHPLGESHTHHHPDQAAHAHAPHIAGPLDGGPA